MHRGEPDALIDAVNAVAIRPVAGRLGALIQPIEPRIGEPGRGVVRQFVARRVAMAGDDGLRDGLLGRERAAIGHEALELDACMARRQANCRRPLGHDALDIGRHLTAGMAGHHPHPQPDPRLGRHRAGPFAPLDPPEIDIDRVIIRRERRMPPLAGVHLMLIGFEPPGDRHRRLDRIHPGMHLAHMRRLAGDMHPGPDHAHLSHIQHRPSRPRLGNETGLRLRQSLHYRQRTIARTFLLDDGGELQLRRRLQPRQPQCLPRHQAGS